MATVINVTLNGNRLFSTNRGSCKTPKLTLALLTLLKSKFPVSEGYAITVFTLNTEAVQTDEETLTAQAALGAQFDHDEQN